MAQAQAQMQTKWWSGGKSPFNVEYGKLMMWYFLMSDAFTFGAFLISYGTIRFSQNYWPDPNQVFNAFPFAGHANLPLAFVSLMTFILIVSSVTMVLAVHAGHKNDKQGVIKWMVWTVLGGIAFLSCQAWEWAHLITGEHAVMINGELKNIGTTVTMNPWGPAADMASHEGHHVGTPGPVAFGGYFFGITGFHGFHVFVGMLMLLFITLRLQKGHFSADRHFGFEGAAWYWHFVDVVWLGLYVLVYWM